MYIKYKDTITINCKHMDGLGKLRDDSVKYIFGNHYFIYKDTIYTKQNSFCAGLDMYCVFKPLREINPVEYLFDNIDINGCKNDIVMLQADVVDLAAVNDNNLVDKIKYVAD